QNMLNKIEELQKILPVDQIKRTAGAVVDAVGEVKDVESLREALDAWEELEKTIPGGTPPVPPGPSPRPFPPPKPPPRRR
ncbi:MAG: hypothetical protein ABIH42_08680, partial [Planctomycetota bacterium]